MKKMIYTPPKADLVLFSPDHALAAGNDNSAWWSFWNWGKYTGAYSATGTKAVWDDSIAPDWIYKGNSDKNDKPY